MKIFAFNTGMPKQWLPKKFLLVMKITTLFLLIAIMQVSAVGFAQKINLAETNVSLKKLINEIRGQSGYNFLYTKSMLKNAKPVSITVYSAKITDVLDQVFAEQPLTYTIVNNTIVIKEREKAPDLSQIIQPLPFAAIAVTGRVTDERGQSLPGVSILIKGTTQGTVTDNDGKYRISVADNNATLIFRYVGFVSQEVTVNGKNKIDVILKEDQKALNEIVVVGYGTTKKTTLTGAVSTLDMKTKENTPITNASQALHGVSGLWVNQAGGQPGADAATIRIRGVGTLNNSNPLVLVDGIEYDLNEINPDFIESITVLKDASAAIYGSRAANGVILVTTKTGKQGKTQVNYSYSYGIQKPTFLPDVLWDPIQYMQLKDQALINEGKSASAVDYSPAQIAEYQAGMATDPITYPNLNWFDIVLKNGMLQQHNLSFSGGSDKVVYNVGLGYMDQDGILIKANHANRYTLNVNVSANVSSKLRVGTNIVGNYRTYTQPPFSGASATSYYFNRLMRVLPIFTPQLADGRWGSVVFATPGRNTIENPLMLLSAGNNTTNVQRTLAKIFADYQLPFGLKYSINFGVDKMDGLLSYFQPYLVSYNPKTQVPNNYNINPSSNNQDNNNLNISFYQTLNWEKTFNKIHNISAMVGTSYNSFNTAVFTGHAEGYFDNTLTDLDAGALNQMVTGRTTKDVLASYFGRVNYSYKEKYLLEGTFRYDGSSRFIDGKRWGAFPSASAGWRIDKEDFFKVKNIDLLKLRASWGKLGNQAVDLYSYLNTVALGANYSFNNALASGASINSYTDPNISWETTTSYDAGLDVEAYNGMLGLSLDVFKRRTSDILRPINIPYQVGGLTGPTENIGTVDNTGYEIELTHRNKIKDFTYEVMAGVSYVKNNVVDLKGQSIVGARRITIAGSPIDSYYLYQADGIYQTQDEVNSSAKISNAVKPGYIKYKDINNDGKIDGSDRVIVGTSSPKYQYSFNINLGYKSFGLTSFFQGVQGINLYPTANYVQPFNNGAGVTREWLTDAWTPTNTNAKLPIVTTATGATENYQPSTFWLEDGSYLRLKDIQLRYDFPKKWVSKIALSKLTLFVNGENLFTITKFKDFDPEKNVTNDNLYEYPTLKTYSFGINATFK